MQRPEETPREDGIVKLVKIDFQNTFENQSHNNIELFPFSI